MQYEQCITAPYDEQQLSINSAYNCTITGRAYNARDIATVSEAIPLGRPDELMALRITIHLLSKRFEAVSYPSRVNCLKPITAN